MAASGAMATNASDEPRLYLPLRIHRPTPASSPAHPPSTTVLGHAGTRRGLEDSDAPASTPSLRQTQGEDDRATANRLLAPSCASAAIGRFPARTPSHMPLRAPSRHRRALASGSMRVLSWRLRSTEAA